MQPKQGLQRTQTAAEEQSFSSWVVSDQFAALQESTLSVDLLDSRSLQLASGDVAYSFEYELDSTRGRKRIMNVVTISKARLYILNGQCKCESAGCNADVVKDLQRIASSFTLR
jgi:endo-alpha-1,4-polygalactosaminidase (GH114 family)